MANEQDQITEEVGCSGDSIEEGFLIRSDRVLTDIRSRKFFNGYFNYIPAKFGVYRNHIVRLSARLFVQSCPVYMKKIGSFYCTQRLLMT